MEIKTRFEDKSEQNISYISIPDECPICHRGIDARIFTAYCKCLMDDFAQIVFQCPSQDCLCFFIGYYRRNLRDYYTIVDTQPAISKDRQFTEIIMSVSPQFIKIFNESSYAEQLNLKTICGAGYRKALEFLIKDYAISLVTTEEIKQFIKKETLTTVIKNYIDNQPIKDNAERAAWLGNDETHYVRLWDDKDLEDLKILIELTVRWIEMEKMSHNYKKDMPQGKRVTK